MELYNYEKNVTQIIKDSEYYKINKNKWINITHMKQALNNCVSNYNKYKVIKKLNRYDY